MKLTTAVCGLFLLTAQPVLCGDDVHLVTAGADIVPGEVVRVNIGGSADGRDLRRIQVIIDGQLAAEAPSATPETLNVVVPLELAEGRVEVKVVRVSGDEDTPDKAIFTKMVNLSNIPDETVAFSPFRVGQRGGSAQLPRSITAVFPEGSARRGFDGTIEKIESERYRRTLALARGLLVREASRTIYRITMNGDFAGEVTVTLPLPDDLASAHALGKTIEAFGRGDGCDKFQPLGARFDAASNALTLTLHASQILPVHDDCTGADVSALSDVRDRRSQRSLVISCAVN